MIWVETGSTLKPHGLGDMRFDARIDLGEGADGAGDRAGGDFLAGGDEPLLGARELGIGVSELEPEGDRFGMDAVRSPDRRRQLVLEGAALERGEQRIDVLDENVGGAHQLHVETRVQHVGRRHARVHEACFRPDDLRDMRQEGDDVVLDLGLDGVDAGDVELGGLSLFPDFLGGFFRDDAEFGHGVGRMRLDLEPDAEFGLRRPDRDHVGAGVARDHRCTGMRGILRAGRPEVVSEASMVSAAFVGGSSERSPE